MSRVKAFPAEYSLANWPFTATSSMRSSSGFILPRDVIRDANVYTNFGENSVDIRAIVIEPDNQENSDGLITLTLGTNTATQRFIGSFRLSTGAETVELYDQYNRSSGVLLLGDTSVFRSWVLGTHVFRTGDLRLEPSCYVPLMDRTVTGFLLPDNTVSSGRLNIVGKVGVCIEQRDNVFTFHFTGEPLFDRYLKYLEDDKAERPRQFATPHFLKKLTIVTYEKDTDSSPSFGPIHLYPDENNTVSIVAFNILLEEDVFRLSTGGSEINIALASA